MVRQIRATYKYKLRVKRRVVHGGITNDPVRREREHHRKWPTARLRGVGRRTTRTGARRWERKHGYR